MAEMILVVDDDPDIARFVEVNLRSAGFDVAVATDGEEALRRADEIRPDLVLLDVMMPRVDGFEVAQRLRRNTRTANTCIIMLTAKAQSSDKVLGLIFNYDGHSPDRHRAYYGLESPEPPPPARGWGALARAVTALVGGPGSWR